METKLTLILDKKVIEQAKEYAKSNRVSLSKIVESYLSSLVHDKEAADSEITPLVKSLSGVVRLENGFDHKRRYSLYLGSKYQ